MYQEAGSLSFLSLPDDISHAILLQSASDLNFAMDLRIKQTLRNMCVCNEWHQIIDESSAIWGRLAWVNHSIEGIDWLSKCLEKSKSSLLWVEGEVVPSFSPIFFRTLSEQWGLIERLVVDMHDLVENEVNHQLSSIYQRPAPFLRTFFLYKTEKWPFNSRRHQENSGMLATLPKTSTGLLHLGMRYISSLDVTSLRNLQTLHIYPSSQLSPDIHQFLHALSSIPRLETMAVFSSFDVGPKYPLNDSHPSVSLPYLTTMVTQTDIDTFLTLWNSITPSSNGCMTSCMVLSDISIVPIIKEYLMKLQAPFERILSDHVRLCHPSSSQRLNPLSVSLTSVGVELYDSCDIIPDGNIDHRFKFRISITWIPPVPGTLDNSELHTFILSLSQLRDIEVISINISKLSLGHDFQFSTYHQFILAFTSVETIYLDILTLTTLGDLQERVSTAVDEYQDQLLPRLIFPKLITLSLNGKYQSGYQRYGLYSMKRLRKRMLSTLFDFLWLRQNIGCAIQVLSLEYQVDEIHRILSTFNCMEFRGLRVDWTEQGSPNSFVYESGGFFDYDFVVDGTYVLGSDRTY